MVCKITSTKGRRAAYTLVEIIVVTGVSAVVLAAIASFFLFNIRSFTAMTNYLKIDIQTQLALDKMSQQIRQVNLLTAYTTNSLTFQDYDGGTLQYIYNPTNRTLTRTKSGTSQILLTNCDSLSFSFFQRTPNSNTFQPYSTTTVTNAKAIQMTWVSSGTILGSKVNTEAMQSTKVIIRNN